METVSFELIRKIYNHINRTEKITSLLSNRQKWDRLTSALNVLEDTSWAIEYYLSNDYPSEFKGKYLYTYGLLQALFVQEDAVNSISIALFGRKIDFKTSYPKAYAVREMRNDVAGHPTNRGTSNYIYLAQCSLRKDSFYYIKDDSMTEQSENIDVDVYAAISEMASCINEILENAVKELDEELEKYIEQHKGRKMVEIFNLLHYSKEKALLDSVMGAWGYESTKDMVRRCEEELILRYGTIDALDSYKYLLGEIHEIYSLIDEGLRQVDYPLCGQLEKYLLQLLFVKLEELRDYCKETDEYFENGGDAFAPTEEKTEVRIYFGDSEFDEPEE